MRVGVPQHGCWDDHPESVEEAQVDPSVQPVASVEVGAPTQPLRSKRHPPCSSSSSSDTLHTHAGVAVVPTSEDLRYTQHYLHKVPVGTPSENGVEEQQTEEAVDWDIPQLHGHDGGVRLPPAVVCLAILLP